MSCSSAGSCVTVFVTDYVNITRFSSAVSKKRTIALKGDVRTSTEIYEYLYSVVSIEQFSLQEKKPV